jgi:hypothetical protein
MFHKQKLARLVKEKPQVQRLLDDMLKNWEGHYFLPTNPKPEEAVAMMYEHERIGGQRANWTVI